MSFCPTCDREVTPATEILPGGVVVEACPKCEYPFEKRERAQKSKPAARPTPVRVVAADADDMVERVRSRIATLEVELERLAALKREHSTLQRMLRAAERKR